MWAAIQQPPPSLRSASRQARHGRAFLEKAAADQFAFLSFVSNEGITQIFTGKVATVKPSNYNLGDRKYWDYASVRGLASTATSDIERQVQPGFNGFVSLSLRY